jgi:hypothetical protein
LPIALAASGVSSRFRLSGTTALSAWFLGPKGENESLLKEMLAEAVRIHCGDRRAYFPQDPIYITDERKQSREHKESVAALRKHFKKLLKALRGSTPFWSPRWQSHMNWDLTLPGIAGYVAAMLYNPNNVAAEASPVTTLLEMQVGDDLCKMLGYPIPSTDEGENGAIRPWGHITCDGSVANLEAMWASRNLKYYPISLSQALKNEPSLAAVRELTVPLLDGREARLIDLDPWTQLNLKGDDVLALTTRIHREYSTVDSETLSNALDGYTLQSLGWKDFADQYLQAGNATSRASSITRAGLRCSKTSIAKPVRIACACCSGLNRWPRNYVMASRWCYYVKFSLSSI